MAYRLPPTARPTGQADAELALEVIEHGDGVFVLDADFRLVLVNETFERTSGKRRDELLGRVLWEVFPEAAAPESKFWQEYRRAMRDRVRVRFEERYPPTGVWCGVEAFPLRRGGLAVFFRDVTAQRRAEEALRASDAALDAFFAGSPGILNLDDEEFRYLKTDATTPTYFGLTRETIVGRSARELAPAFFDRFGPMLNRVLESGEPVRNVEVHSPLPNRPGEIAFWRASYFRVPLPGGKHGLGVIGVEITDLKRAEEALRESAERFSTLADNIAQLAWMADERGALFWYNRRWLEYTGTTFAEMEGWGWRKVQHPDHVERVEAKYRRHLASGEAWEDTFPLRRHDGVYRWFLSRALPIRDASGKVVRWFGTNTDITEQREAEQALRDADQRKDEFLAVLSHELRSPLAPISNSIYLLEKLPSDTPQAARARDVVRRQTDHLARLVEDLLDVTRISRGKIQLQREVLDLRDVVRRTCEDHRSTFERSQLELTVHLPAAPLWVDVDPTRIAQVVGNLLGNAAKFTPAGGAVSARLEASGGRAELSVRDTGVGIDPAQLARMFEPFVQEDRSLARTRGGLGLGLALSRALVELHGGTIAARSEGAGKGAELVVTLPLQPLAGDAAAAPGSDAAAARRRRVLIVDDHVDAARTLADVLEVLGHEVAVTTDATSGIARARAWRPDVVICDLGLPDVDGFAVARTLRADEALRGTRLVALSGYGQPEDKQRAREAGFERHFTRPAPIEELDAAIR